MPNAAASVSPAAEPSEVHHRQLRTIARNLSCSLVSVSTVTQMSSSSRNRWILWGGFCATVVAFGLKYWLTRYGTVNLPEVLIGPGLGVTGLASAAAVALGAAKFWRGVLIFGSAAPTAVFVRVVVDCIPDPTRHNLWPFEIVIAYGVGLPWAVGGAAIGWCLSRIGQGNRAP